MGSRTETNSTVTLGPRDSVLAVCMAAEPCCMLTKRPRAAMEVTLQASSPFNALISRAGSISRKRRRGLKGPRVVLRITDDNVL